MEDDAPAAGGYNRIKDTSGVAHAMRDHAMDFYGPSQHAFDRWKKSGIPTAEQMQPTTFGMASRKGDTAGDALTGRASVPFTAPPNMSTASIIKQQQRDGRANPITWMGGPPVAEPRRYYEPLTGRQMTEPAQPPPPPPPPKPPPSFEASDTQQTWSTLMRTGKVKSSARAGEDRKRACVTPTPPPTALSGTDRRPVDDALEPATCDAPLRAIVFCVP
jgi:hypothetical protein